MQAEDDYIRLELKVGSIVKGFDPDGEEWRTSVIQEMSGWGVLLQPIDEDRKPNGHLFTCLWHKVEILPEYFGIGEHVFVEPNEPGPDPRDLSINSGCPIVPEHGVAQGVPAAIGARVFDNEGGEGVIFGLTDQLVLYRDDDGLEHCQRFGHCSATLRPPQTGPGLGLAGLVRVGDTVQAEHEPGSGWWEDCEVVEVHETHLVVENREDGDEDNVSVGWLQVKLYPTELTKRR